MSNQWSAQKLSEALKSSLSLSGEDMPSDPSSLRSWLDWPNGKGGKHMIRIISPQLLVKGDIIIRDATQDYIAIVYEGGSVSAKYKIVETDLANKKFIKKTTTGNISSILRFKGLGASSPNMPTANVPTTPYTGQSNFNVNGAVMDKLNSKFRQRCEMMAADFLKLTGRKMNVSGPISGYRTYAQQVQVYKTARKGYAATPGRSNHGFGFALDVTSADANAAAKLGLLTKYGLHRPMSYEPWHIEPVGLNKAALKPYRDRYESGKYTGDELAFAYP